MRTPHMFQSLRDWFKKITYRFAPFGKESANVKHNAFQMSDESYALLDGYMNIYSYVYPRLNIENDSQKIYQRIYDNILDGIDDAGFAFSSDFSGDKLHDFKVTVAPTISSPVVTSPAIFHKKTNKLVRMGHVVFPQQ